MDCQLSEKRAIGFNVHLGFELGYFFGIESEFNDRARKLAISLIILNLKMNHKYSKNVNLDYGLYYSSNLYDVPLFDGSTSGNLYGIYAAPWVGNKVKFGVKVAFGHAHVDGGNYSSLNSIGLYSTLIYIRIPLYKKK